MLFSNLILACHLLAPFAQGPVVSEFLAENSGGLLDGDGDSSDWIEIYNPSLTALDMDGYFLSDDSGDLQKWMFPAQTYVQPQECLLVYASGKNRQQTGLPLHTNFKLKGSGEYLGLISPDGITVLSEYAPEFPAQHEDISYGFRFNPGLTSETSFFSSPTPGSVNSSGGVFVIQSTSTPEFPLAQQDIVVSVQLDAGSIQIQQVAMYSRVMYGPESLTLLADNGIFPDLIAGDDWWTGTISGQGVLPGEMVRWRIEASDSLGQNGQGPLHPNLDSAEYYGTAAGDPSVTSDLLVLQWFVEDPLAAETSAGTRCSIWHMGEFYDNQFCRKRGASTASYNKKSYKIDFNPGEKFRMFEGISRMEEINLNTTWSDKSYVRPFVAVETYKLVGAETFMSEPIHLMQNGGFKGLYVFAEQIDDEFLGRLGHDPNGAMYKMYNQANMARGNEKKTRLWEGIQDLQDLIDGMQNPIGAAAIETYIFDNINIPAVVSYLVGGMLMQETDHLAHNYYLYRDSDGDEEWRFFPWDKDLTFGREWTPQDGVLNDGMKADVDPVSHPFMGNQANPGHAGYWNRIIDGLYKVPRFREMYSRRLWEMMEAHLESPGTPLADTFYESLISAWEARLSLEVDEDIQVWGSPSWGIPQTFQQAIALMSTDYFQPRRTHLFQTHRQSGELPGPRVHPSQIVLGLMETDPISGDKNEEWLEIKNLGAEAVDISEWMLSGDIEFMFDPGTVIAAMDSIYVSPRVKSFRSRAASPTSGESLFVVGPFLGNLSLGEDLFLWNRDGGLEDSNSTSFTLFTNQFVSGEEAIISVAGATPLGAVLVAWSVTGAGPTPTQYGVAELSMPIKVLPVLTSDSSGMSKISITLPATSSGIQVWFQAADLSAGALSNGAERIVQ